jgi:hypothetical protein
MGVRIPALRTNSEGITWHGRRQRREQSIPLDKFYIAHPERHRRHHQRPTRRRQSISSSRPESTTLTEPIRVTHPNTSRHGPRLRYAPSHQRHRRHHHCRRRRHHPRRPAHSMQARELAGSGANWLPKAVTPSHAKNPISLHDVFFRVGGAGPGSAGVNLEVNSNDTIIDHTWIWRADHGIRRRLDHQPQRQRPRRQRQQRHRLRPLRRAPPAISSPVERQRGRTYFYQSEIPYDPPDQQSYTSGIDAKARASTAGRPTKWPTPLPPRSLGSRRLLGLPPSQRRPAHPRH